MKYISSWLQIAENAHILSKKDKTGNADVILAIACEVLEKAGFPCDSNDQEIMIELNGEDVCVKRHPIIIDTEKTEKIDRLTRENRKLKDRFAALNKLMTSFFGKEHMLESDATTEEKGPLTKLCEVTPVQENIVMDEKNKPHHNEDSASSPVSKEIIPPKKMEEPENLQLIQAEKTDDNMDAKKDEAVEDGTEPIDTTAEQADKHPDGKEYEPIAEDTLSDPMSGYKEMLHIDEFALTHHTIDITQPDSSIHTTFEVIASPMTMEEGEVPIMAWVNDFANHATYISEEETEIRTNVGNIGIVIKGSVTDGVFHTKVELTKDMLEKDVQISILSQEAKTGNGHNMIKDKDIQVHIVPRSYNSSHEKDQLAEYYYAIFINGQDTLLGDSISNPITHFWFHSEEHVATAIWKDNVLYVGVSPIKDLKNGRNSDLNE